VKASGIWGGEVVQDGLLKQNEYLQKLFFIREIQEEIVQRITSNADLRNYRHC
jgi:hypothetical protein